MKPWLKTLVILLIGFLLGAAATGLVLRHFFQPHHPPGLADADRILNRLDSKLGFTAEQREKVRLLLNHELPKADKLRKETDTKFQAIWLNIRAGLRPLLNPGQIQKYNAMVAKWEKHEKEMEKRHAQGNSAACTGAVTGK
jgi:hypothetical protein